jgi:DNA primase
MTRLALDDLKQRISLLDYLQAQNWRPVRQLTRNRWMGLCPLHPDRKPSFLVDAHKSLFYCYGCGRGGDIFRFVELYHQINFAQALAALLHWHGRGGSPLRAAADFYHIQLHRRREGLEYLYQRGIHDPEVIQHMRLGYAPGGCLRRFLIEGGYPLSSLRESGLVNAAGYDSFCRRIVVPLESNLYGRSISPTAPPHRFLPGSKGGLYLWEHARRYTEVILVEALLDYAAVWQAGFRNLTCAMGTQLNAHQMRQLCSGPRTVYLAFDADSNGSGHRAAQRLAQQLAGYGLTALQMTLPEGLDPNRFFQQGGDAHHFQTLLEQARR